MKQFLSIALLGLAVLTFAPPATNTASGQTVSIVGTRTDTAKSNTTKTQKVFVGNNSQGITLSYNLHHLTDTITGYVSVWGSVDDSTYAPYPGLDSVAIAAVGDVSKLWFVNTKASPNPVKYIKIYTRCPSNTTNATSKAKVTSKVLPY